MERDMTTTKKFWASLAVLLLLGLAAAAVISNNLPYSGELQGNFLELSYTNGDPNPVVLISGQPEVFNLTAANKDDAAVDYFLHISFTPSMTVSSVSGALTHIYLDAGSYVKTTEVLSWTLIAGTYEANPGLYNLVPFEATWFELELTVIFSGAGTYNLDIVAET